jgi:hypothetical protein
VGINRCELVSWAVVDSEGAFIVTVLPPYPIRRIGVADNLVQDHLLLVSITHY